MLRRIAFVISILAIAGFVMPELSIVHVSEAQAQSSNKPKRKNLLELLFGGGLKKKRSKAKAAIKKSAKRVKVKKRRKKKSSTKRSVATASNAAIAKPKVEKAEDAAKVLVIGDFMADQLGQGLQNQFASNPGIQIVDKSLALSGMVRDDVKNWPMEIGSIIDEIKPIVVVALVGMNDRQQIRSADGKFNKLTDEWVSVYEKRADELARNIREKRLPMIWVGLPPVSKGKMNTDYLKFNEIYRKTVEAYGGIYVDVWDGFVDTEGRFVRSGPDVNGQIVSLRRADGINMTNSGKVKLGFYAEKAVKKMTGFSKDSLVSSLGVLSDLAGPTEPQYDPVSSGKTIVIALGAASADGGAELEGAGEFLTATDARKSNSFDLVAKGLAVQPKPGRIDAIWGKPSFALDRDETPEPVLANLRGYSLKSYLDELPPIDLPNKDNAKNEETAPASN